MQRQRPDIDKIHLYVKDPFESKFLLHINGREKLGIKKLKNLKTFINYSQTNDDVYENLEDYKPKKKRRVLIVFDDMQSDQKLIPIVTELFFRGRKISFFACFYTIVLLQSA